MSDIYIFGSSGFAREIYFLIKDIGNYNIKAFVEKTSSEDEKIELDGTDFPIILESEFDDICSKNFNISAVIAIADPSIVSKIIERYKSKCQFPNLIHPNSKMIGKLRIGVGNIISYGCFLSDNVSIGSFNRFNIGNHVGHDVKIGNNNHFNSSCNISGNVIIENNNFFGVNSVVLQGIQINSNVIIGASSLVVRKIKESGTYVGAPAIRLKF